MTKRAKCPPFSKVKQNFLLKKYLLPDISDSVE
jgi:hypothetical protein